MFAGTGCRQALARDSVCERAVAYADDLMRSRHLMAVTVVQQVSTGAVVLFAASEPDELDVSTPVLPLSLSKVFLAASWWEHKLPDREFESVHGTETAENPAYRKKVNAHEMLVGGSDSAGIQMALALRKAVGAQAVLDDLSQFGFNRSGPSFWAEVDSEWKIRLKVQTADASLNDLSDEAWGSALSIGESHMSISALQVSQFFQAVGNDGVSCSPVALRLREDSHEVSKRGCIAPSRMMNDKTAARLMNAMLDTVKRGTANGISAALKDVGWSMGGKTGTGGLKGAPTSEQDGWFAGLIFDRKLKARFTVATFTRRGGTGGGNAAEISAGVAHFLATDEMGN
jgi:cell division protein FtsI/penicillin-binding protein 2